MLNGGELNGRRSTAGRKRGAGGYFEVHIDSRAIYVRKGVLPFITPVSESNSVLSLFRFGHVAILGQ